MYNPTACRLIACAVLLFLTAPADDDLASYLDAIFLEAGQENPANRVA